MRTLLAILAVAALSACQTKLYYPNGQLALSTGANTKRTALKGGGMEFVTDGLNHSTPTLAAGKSAGNVISSAGSAAMVSQFLK